ncbi:MAG: hypothetical protein ACRDHW_07665, partial [Ktedonobacteraceae bacterium]
AQLNEMPTLLNTSLTPNPIASTDKRTDPPATLAALNQYYDPIRPALQPPLYSPSEHKGMSRRTALITGLSAAGVIAVGGIAWQIVGHSASPGTGTTNGQTPTAQKTGVATTASPTAPTIPGLLVQDTFHRPDQTLWGMASDGNRWGGDAGTSNDFSIFHQTGQIHRTTNGQSLYTAVLGTTYTDVEILVTAMLNSFNNSHIGAMLRYRDDNHYYKVVLDGNSLRFLKRIDPQHGPTPGQPLPYSPRPQTFYTLRFRITGTMLLAKVWQANTAEPSNWMLTANDNDATFQTGKAGLRPQLDKNVTLNVTMFQATLAAS